MNSLELRIEGMKCLSNLQFQLLQSVYVHDGRSIAELYMNGESILHIHGLTSDYRFCATLRNAISDGGFGYSKVHVFVRVGQTLENMCPVTSVIRLQPLDNCDMFIADTFEMEVTPSLESLYGIMNRKLCAIYNRARIKICQLIDEVIQGSSQVVDDFSNEDADNVWHWFNRELCITKDNLSPFTIFRNKNLWFAFNDNVITDSLAECINPAIQIRQVYACPSNPLISAIQRLHMLYYPYEQGEKDAKDTEGIRNSHTYKGRVRYLISTISCFSPASTQVHPLKPASLPR